MSIDTNLCEELKRLIVERLSLSGLTISQIPDDAPLFGEGLGLDSIDALELVVGLEQKYGIAIKTHEIDKSVFDSIQTLAHFVESVRMRGVSDKRGSDETRRS